MDMSTMTPIRNPSKMPFLTQVFTRHPVADEGSGSAARIKPWFRACLNPSKTRKSSSVYCGGGVSKRVATRVSKAHNGLEPVCSLSRMDRALRQQAHALQHLFDFGLICRSGRDQRQTPGRLE